MNTAKNTVGRTDLAILIAATLLLLVNLGAIGPMGRERAKRAVCLANLRQLTSAWPALSRWISVNVLREFERLPHV